MYISNAKLINLWETSVSFFICIANCRGMGALGGGFGRPAAGASPRQKESGECVIPIFVVALRFGIYNFFQNLQISFSLTMPNEHEAKLNFYKNNFSEQ